MYFDPGPREYESYFDGPAAKLYRHEWEAEQRKLRVIDGLLDSLVPEDSTRPLFAFWEIQTFDLKRRRKER